MCAGDWDGAIAACKAALQLVPVDAKLHGYLGCCYFRKGDYASAIEPFRRATALNPKFWEAGTKLAQCYDRLHRYEEAYATAKEWLHVRPGDHTLEGIVFALKDMVHGPVKEGWERTEFLAHHVEFSNG
jgi:Flp pilus assembly protein TadD